MKTQVVDGVLGFHPFFGIWHNKGGRVVSSNKAVMYPCENSLLLSGPQGYWMWREEKRSFENFQEPYWESNPEPPILWCSVSTNCATPTVHQNTITTINDGLMDFSPNLWCYRHDMNITTLAKLLPYTGRES
jgi:hypothetical protein